jgi:hypothetical protein
MPEFEPLVTFAPVETLPPRRELHPRNADEQENDPTPWLLLTLPPVAVHVQ